MNRSCELTPESLTSDFASLTYASKRPSAFQRIRKHLGIGKFQHGTGRQTACQSRQFYIILSQQVRNVKSSAVSFERRVRCHDDFFDAVLMNAMHQSIDGQ